MPKLYMVVTKDELELPLAVADTLAELAEFNNMRPQSVRALLLRSRRGERSEKDYISVDTDDNEEFIRFCNHCDTFESVFADKMICNSNMAANHFRQRGWRVICHKSYCPDCVEKFKQKGKIKYGRRCRKSKGTGKP